MRVDGRPDDPYRVDVTTDAVVVIPGIMGSELADRATGTVLWGLTDGRWFARAWTSDDGLHGLAISDAERQHLADGTYDPDRARVRPTGLLRLPISAPLLRGVEPYDYLLRKIRDVVVHRDAVLEFAYDWRLPVAFNTRLLAGALQRHLQVWRAHPALAAYRSEVRDDRPSRVVIVAHSMGGLLAHGLSLLDGATSDIRTTITLGTPFYGSVKAAVLLNSGRGAPLPRQQLQRVAATLPGVYDLLPTYRCLLTTGADGHDDVVRLTPTVVESLGGNQVLAAAAFAHHERLEQAAITGHRPVVGTEQPTLQSLTVTGGVATAGPRSYLWHCDGELRRDPVGQLLYKDYRGDGTVYRYAATPRGVDAAGLAQTHGALAASAAAAAFVRAVLTDQGELGIRLGAGDLGLDVPDVATAGEPFDLTVTGEADPAAVTCVVTHINPSDERVIARPLLAARRDSQPGLTASVRLPEPGLYRIGVTTGGSDPVTELVIAVDNADRR